LSGMFIKAPEVVIATSPQLLVGLAGWWVSRIHGAHFIFEVRDLWPESLVAVGASGQKSLMVNVLRAIASFLYRYADKIVVVSPAFCEYLIQHWKVPVEKIEIVENGVEAELFSKSVDIAKVRERFHLGSGIVVSYIGTLGMAHGLETLLGAAAQLSKTHSSITFLLLGEGAAKKDISDRIVQLGLTNMKLHSAVLREEVPDVIAASDICLVLLRRSEVFKTVIPTKMLEFMAGGKAVILGAEGQAQQILEEAKGGLCITPEDTNGLSSAISRLAEDKELRQRLGNNGRKYVEENLSRKKSAVEYIAVMEMFNHTE